LEDHYNVWEHTIAQICDILSDQIPCFPLEKENQENVFWLINVINFLALEGIHLLKIVELSDKKQIRKAIKRIEKADCEDGPQLSKFFIDFAVLIQNFGPHFVYSSDDEPVSDVPASSSDDDDAYDSAIEDAASSVNPLAVRAAGEAYDAKDDDIEGEDSDYFHYSEELDDVSCNLGESWSCIEGGRLKYSVRMYHARTSTHWFIIYKNGWYAAQLKSFKMESAVNCLTTVVGSPFKEEFKEMLEAFLATLPKYRSS